MCVCVCLFVGFFSVVIVVFLTVAVIRNATILNHSKDPCSEEFFPDTTVPIPRSCLIVWGIV